IQTCPTGRARSDAEAPARLCSRDTISDGSLYRLVETGCFERTISLAREDGPDGAFSSAREGQDEQAGISVQRGQRGLPYHGDRAGRQIRNGLTSDYSRQ